MNKSVQVVEINGVKMEAAEVRVHMHQTQRVMRTMSQIAKRLVVSGVLRSKEAVGAQQVQVHVQLMTNQVV